MMFIRSAVSHIPSSHSAAILAGRIQIRNLSSEGQVAVTKLRCALEEYRKQNYSQELHSRFTKDIVEAAKQKGADAVAIAGLQQVMANINMQDKISEQEMKTIFSEMGGSSGLISADNMMKML